MSNIEDFYCQINVEKDKEKESKLIYIKVTPEFLNPETIGNYNKEAVEKYKIKNIGGIESVCRS